MISSPAEADTCDCPGDTDSCLWVVLPVWVQRGCYKLPFRGRLLWWARRSPPGNREVGLEQLMSGWLLGWTTYVLGAHGGASSEGRGHTQETTAQTQGTCRHRAVGLHPVPGPQILWRARPGWTQGGLASGVVRGRFERALIFYRQVIHGRVWMGKGSSDIDSVIGRVESFLSGVRNILSGLPIRGLAAPYLLPPACGCPLLVAFNPHSLSCTSSC